jgi:hypothetical protein
MKTLKLWWVWAPLVFTLQMSAQPDSGDESPHKGRFVTVNKVKLIYFDAAFDHSRVPASLRFKPLHGGRLEALPTKEESESPDGRRRWISRLFGEEKSRVMYSMMEGTYSETHHYGRIKAPALAFFAVGYQEDVDSAKTLPEPQRQAVLEFLKTQRKYHEQEIEYFRKTIPNGRTIVFTNAIHQFPLNREAEILREVQKFLAPANSSRVEISLRGPIDVQIPMPPTPVKADGNGGSCTNSAVIRFP